MPSMADWALTAAALVMASALSSSAFSCFRSAVSDAATGELALPAGVFACNVINAATPMVRSRSSSMACASAVTRTPTSASRTLREYALAVPTASAIRRPPKTRPSTLAMANSAISRVETDQLDREDRRTRSGRALSGPARSGPARSGRALPWSPARIAGMSVWLARRRPITGASGPLIALPSHIHVVAAGKST